MKLALFGYGRMGKVVEEIAEERGHEVTLRVDARTAGADESITPESLAGARTAVDFSVADAVLPHVRRAAELELNIVIGTTGWERDRFEVEAVVRESGIGLLHAPNFSIGMLLFTRIVESAARLLNPVEDYDLHLWEAHHRHKVDHPGGTAVHLAELLVREMGRKDGWSTDLPEGATVDPRILQVAVSRVGEVPGVHGVGFEGPDDRIELQHRARNRRGFARGAVIAAEWLEGRSGLHTMNDLLDDLTGTSQ